MNQTELMQSVSDTAKMLYQNREHDGLEQAEIIIKVLQQLVEKQSGEQMQAAGAFSVAMMRELMEAYQNSDVMGVADCLMEKQRYLSRSIFRKMIRAEGK